MATPVPYEGAPDRVPGFDPTPNVNVEASPAAFGANIAEAASHMGQVIEGSGKELFDRAYAMQELQVHADVNARMSSAINDMQNEYVNFSELEGKNAVDGLSGFQSKLDEIRQKAGDGLSPAGQEFYDQESRSQRYRIGFAGAGHAAQQQKAYVLGASEAQTKMLQRQMELDPDNQAANAQTIKAIQDQADFQSSVHGLPLDGPQANLARADAVNTGVQQQIRAMAKSDPIKAGQLLDQQIKSGNVYGSEVTGLSWYVTNQRNTIGSRQAAEQVLGANSGHGGPILRALIQNESGGQVHITQGNIGDVNNKTGDLAQGAFQITTGTWHEFAARAGIDLAAYSDANSAPYAVQAQMANVIPLRRWGAKTISAMEAAGAKLDLNKTLGENLRANGEGLGPGVDKQPTLVDLSNQARDLAESQFPGDKNYSDMVVDRTITQFTKEKQIQADTNFNNEQSIWNALTAGVGPDHKTPTSVDELRLDPQASQAWDQLQQQKPSELQKFMNQMAHNARGGVTMTSERLNNWQKLVGLSERDPEEFMKQTLDLGAVDLPIAQKQEIIRMQKAIYNKEDAAPQLGHAMSLLERTGVLHSAGIGQTDGDTDNRDLFTGVLHDVMTQYNKDNGKPMSDVEVKKAASQLLTDVPTGNLIFNRSAPWFESSGEVPDEFAKEASKTLTEAGYMPSEQMILQTYLSMQYQKAYGKPAKSQVPSGK